MLSPEVHQKFHRPSCWSVELPKGEPVLDSNSTAASRLSIQPEFGTAIVTHATCPFLVAHVAESEFFPHVDGRLELVVLNVIERERDPR